MVLLFAKKRQTFNIELIRKARKKRKVKELILFAVIIVVAIAFLKFMALPLKFAVKVLINTMSGFFLMFAANLIGGIFGVYVPVTFFRAIIAGVLGIPGVILIWIIYLM